MKKRIFLLTAVFLLMMAAGCGNGQDNSKEKGEPVMGDGQNKNEAKRQEKRPGNDGQGIAAGAIEPSLSVLEEKPGQVLLRYELKNQTEQVKELHFTSGKRYDYTITDKEGNVVYEFSKEHMFMQVLNKVTIKQGDSYVQDIMIKNLPPGKYKVEVWLTAKDEPQNYRKTIEVELK
ncbi:BsuPI-related putative proteinase inhibitor [Fictibacillus aquaticus]|uniref:Intracellular proteinase inhibitor BsuPI domain-containing protein n=1 Tax=Fictibacillus aquaticus TaxID=2021314 RepID=A0A235FDY3_9BACL|nr:BsuPI-related putative proteinase inhibitor [Fictibacillus aquaticus]OYD59586.1 hypothetical protein CGZ90_06770 [Fictibacillus aquaticus]